MPAQPIKASKPPSSLDWVHSYRIIVRRDGPTVRLYSRNAYGWTARLLAIASAAQRIKAKSFTIDGEAVILGPDGLSRFEELRRREAADAAILYAFDLIEHDGADLHNLPFLERKAALARLLRDTEVGILLNEHIVGDGLLCSSTLAGLAESIVSKKSMALIDRGRARSGSKFGIPPASLCSGSAARSGIGDRDWWQQRGRRLRRPQVRRLHKGCRAPKSVGAPIGFGRSYSHAGKYLWHN